MPRPFHRPLFMAGMACLALGTAFPLVVRRGLVPETAGDLIHGVLLGLALGLLIMSLRRGRRTGTS